MHYLILGQDVENSLETRLANRPTHIERLQALKSEGRLVLAGPTPISDHGSNTEPGFSGSAIIAQFDSLEAAQAWAAQDPYLLNGVYESVSVTPFNIAISKD